MKTNGLLSKMDIGLGLVCVFMIFCLLTIFTNTDLGSYDLWLHLKTGEVILQDGAVPHYDIYSFTRQGSKWVDHGWLFQVAAYSFYNKWQVPGLFLMKTAVASLTFSTRFSLRILTVTSAPIDLPTLRRSSRVPTSMIFRAP